MKKRTLASPLIAMCLLASTSCKENPVNRLTNALESGVVPQSSGVMVIYDEEIKTGGGMAFLAGGENQSIDLNDRSAPRRTEFQIHDVWNGQPVGGQHAFAGFQFTITPDGSTLALADAKDLSAPAYNRLTFWVRGSLGNNVRLRIEGPAFGNEPSDDDCVQVGCLEIDSLTNEWRYVEMVINPARLNAVKIFATFSYQYDEPPRTGAGQGGTIYLDDIQYERM